MLRLTTPVEAESRAPTGAPAVFAQNRTLRRIWTARSFYLMLLPGIIWYLVFRYLPMAGLVLAFKEYNFNLGILGSPWANPWYKHFALFFNSPYFTQILGNTIIISLLKIVFGLIPPLLLAILLNEVRVGWFKRGVQTLTYMPHFLSWVIIYGILIALFSQTTGLINHWIVQAGGTAYPFLTSTETFRSVLVGSDLWQNAGWAAIIYLAAITAIDPTLYEAARVDGANRLQLIRNITLPGVKSVFIVLLILRLGQALDAGFEQVYILYSPQVYPVADIIDTWVFRTGLQQLNFSLATAVGLFKSAIGLVLVLVTNRIARRSGGGLW